jgi:uncharacterized protein YwgA
MPTTRQALLAGVLRRIGQFSLDKFQDRLRLQKTVYLLQAFGIYLGYNFNWYLYGPYSPALARDAFKVMPLSSRFGPQAFSDGATEERFRSFVEFLGGQKNDPQWLELVASLHMLNRLYGGKGKEVIFRKMAQKQPYLSEEKRIGGWQRLREFGLV